MLSRILITLFLWPAAAQALCPSGYEEGRVLSKGLQQLSAVKPGSREIADPAPPFETEAGSVEIYGTGDTFLRYPSWKEFNRAGCYQQIKLDLYFRGKDLKLLPSDAPWDLRKFELTQGSMKKEILLGGAMSPSSGHELPRWPEDNASRRVYIFRQSMEKPGAWIRDEHPVTGGDGSGWLGHSYGGNLFQEGQEKPQVITSGRPTYLFYEKVSTEQGPEKTGLYVSKSGENGAEEQAVFADSPYPANKRSIGGTLAEGPRPIEVSIKGKKFFLVGFSSGDFPTDQYSINFLWSRKIAGPYEPMLTKDGKDLEDFGAGLKQEYGLSWVGRPVLFRTPGGKYELMFHGVFKNAHPGNDFSKWPSAPLQDFVRAIFKVPVQLGLGRDGKPAIQLNP